MASKRKFSVNAAVNLLKRHGGLSAPAQLVHGELSINETVKQVHHRGVSLFVAPAGDFTTIADSNFGQPRDEFRVAGVYFLFNGGRAYVGKSENLARRIREHLRGGSYTDVACFVGYGLDGPGVQEVERILLEQKNSMLDCLENRKGGVPAVLSAHKRRQSRQAANTIFEMAGHLPRSVFRAPQLGVHRRLADLTFKYGDIYCSLDLTDETLSRVLVRPGSVIASGRFRHVRSSETFKGLRAYLLRNGYISRRRGGGFRVHRHIVFSSASAALKFCTCGSRSGPTDFRAGKKRKSLRDVREVLGMLLDQNGFEPFPTSAGR